VPTNHHGGKRRGGPGPSSTSPRDFAASDQEQLVAAMREPGLTPTRRS
jgi:hypothetical protein